jgi:hypothetical protein
VPAGAGAATKVGQVLPSDPSPCGAPLNLVQTAVTSGTPYEVPAGGGVITRWQHRGRLFASGVGRLQVWKPAGGTSFKLVGRSDLMPFSDGVLHDFRTRVPVSGGELLGLRAQTASPFVGCVFGAPAGNTYNSETGTDPAPGQTRTLGGPIDGGRLNVSATLEPDADGDGYGDESQDQCPAGASTHGACSFTLGALTGKKLTVTVPGPGTVEVKDAADQSAAGALSAAKRKRLKPTSATATGAGDVIVKLKLTRSAKRKLEQKGKVKVSAAITFTPTAGTGSSQTANLRVKK